MRIWSLSAPNGLGTRRCNLSRGNVTRERHLILDGQDWHPLVDLRASGYAIQLYLHLPQKSERSLPVIHPTIYEAPSSRARSCRMSQHFP